MQPPSTNEKASQNKFFRDGRYRRMYVYIIVFLFFRNMYTSWNTNERIHFFNLPFFSLETYEHYLAMVFCYWFLLFVGEILSSVSSELSPTLFIFLSWSPFLNLLVFLSSSPFCMGIYICQTCLSPLITTIFPISIDGSPISFLSLN